MRRSTDESRKRATARRAHEAPSPGAVHRPTTSAGHEAAFSSLASSAWLGRLVTAGGLALLVIAVLADLAGISIEPGIGRRQVILALTGYAAVAAGRAVRVGTSGWALSASREVARTGVVFLELLLLSTVITLFNLENPAFFDKIMPLCVAGFMLHHALPDRFRLRCFVALCAIGIFEVFGLSTGTWLLGIGLGIIGLCHLPAPFRVRVAALLVLGVYLALGRAGLAPTAWTSAIWPILGSMFMFRLIVYMHQLRHRTKPVNRWQTLSYFFLLPNVVFPLFPVVDYKTFERTYYDRDAYVIYQRGVRWLLIGVGHLLLYRLVYHNLVLSATEVNGARSLAQYVTSNFLLYFRVSGQFHLIVGLLHLFGFRLPESNRFFFLASSFTDLWRRINIYWKDFMMKTFYYPALLRLRRWGDTVAVATVIVIIFVLNWALHGYQWFWILGQWPVEVTDIAFWAILGLSMVANTLWEQHHGRRRQLGGQRWSFGESLSRAGRAVSFFISFAVLWALWTSPTVHEFFFLFSSLHVTATGALIGLAFFASLIIALAVAFQLGLWRWTDLFGDRAPGQVRFWRSAGLTLGSGALLLLLGSDALAGRAGVHAQQLVLSMKSGGLNDRDAAVLQRGYYESLNAVSRISSPLWELYARRGGAWIPNHEACPTRATSDARRFELEPLRASVCDGQWYRSNRWGMRDREYARIPPKGMYRVAVMGASHVMGVGVGDGETFEAVAEAMLERDWREGRISVPIEILNFAVLDYSTLNQLAALETRVLSFKPDLVVLVATAWDVPYAARYVAQSVVQQLDLPWSSLLSIIEAANIDSTMSMLEAQQRLEPYGSRILAAAYGEFASITERQGVDAIWVHIPLIEPTPEDVIAELRALADEAGFDTYDFSHALAGADSTAIRVAEWNFHPNAAGHRLFAESFARLIRKRMNSGP